MTKWFTDTKVWWSTSNTILSWIKSKNRFEIRRFVIIFFPLLFPNPTYPKICKKMSSDRSSIMAFQKRLLQYSMISFSSFWIKVKQYRLFCSTSTIHHKDEIWKWNDWTKITIIYLIEKPGDKCSGAVIRCMTIRSVSAVKKIQEKIHSFFAIHRVNNWHQINLLIPSIFGDL